MVMQSLASWQSGVGGTCAPEHHKPVGVVCTPSSHSAWLDFGCSGCSGSVDQTHVMLLEPFCILVLLLSSSSLFILFLLQSSQFPRGKFAILFYKLKKNSSSFVSLPENMSPLPKSKARNTCVLSHFSLLFMKIYWSLYFSLSAINICIALLNFLSSDSVYPSYLIFRIGLSVRLF